MPSILELDSFLAFMKRGELANCAYNHSLLRMREAIQTRGLSDQGAIDHARSATLLFASMTTAFREFFAYRGFSEAKFIYLMRQMTVELSSSPASWLLKGLEFSSVERIRYKAFLDHYLIRTQLTANERMLFMSDVMKNEGVWNEQIEKLSFAYLLRDEPGAREALLAEIEVVSADRRDGFLAPMLAELVETGTLGPKRLKYTLALFVRLGPALAQYFTPLMRDDAWLGECLSALRDSDYAVAPSGANSMAFYGPDSVLGYQNRIANYRIHILNRLPVMQTVDQAYFWEHQSVRDVGIEPTWETWIAEALEDLSDSGSAALNEVSPERITEALLRKPWLSVYVDLFDWYGRFATSHNGSVQKYVRNVAKGMPEHEKMKLTSRPDHGTTFMNPDSVSAAAEAVYDLPSIHTLTSIRKNHPLKDWTQPLAALRSSGRLLEYPDASVVLSEVGPYSFFY
ncbi:MAG: hypothetical protein IPL77_07180 [Flavobacteriales bacterium]|nr:hypothetical protein [Flavobacteriales bacterium]